jgi:hypothetical protein
LKEAYAVRRTVPPSAEIQASIDELLSRRVVDDRQKMLSELARLGARLIIQRAVEEESSTRGLVEPGMSAGRSASAVCATMATVIATGFARAGCRLLRGSLRACSFRDVTERVGSCRVERGGPRQ